MRYLILVILTLFLTPIANANSFWTIRNARQEGRAIDDTREFKHAVELVSFLTNKKLGIALADGNAPEAGVSSRWYYEFMSLICWYEESFLIKSKKRKEGAVCIVNDDPVSAANTRDVLIAAGLRFSHPVLEVLGQVAKGNKKYRK